MVKNKKSYTKQLNKEQRKVNNSIENKFHNGEIINLKLNKQNKSKPIMSIEEAMGWNAFGR